MLVGVLLSSLRINCVRTLQYKILEGENYCKFGELEEIRQISLVHPSSYIAS